MGTATTAEESEQILTHLRRAVQLARRGPRTDPNPRVGCVLVAPDGSVVAEGHHRGAGSPHAEVVALRRAGSAARGSTAHVTLEPCAHTGRTGPCAPALVAAGVARVVYAVPDPTRHATGGADLLRRAGVQVEHRGLPEAQEVTADWVWAQQHDRPRVVWKIASTLDGRVAAADGTSRWITGPQARADAHRLRARVQAVVVGTGTALADDPALTVRPVQDDPGRGDPEQPLRVVVGHRDLPPGARLRQGPGGELVLARTHDPAQVLAGLHRRGAHTVLLEGGPRLAAAFWAAGLIDEVWHYLAPALLGAGPAAVPDLGISTIADTARLVRLDVTPLGPDLRIRLRPVRAPAPTPKEEG